MISRHTHLKKYRIDYDIIIEHFNHDIVTRGNAVLGERSLVRWEALTNHGKMSKSRFVREILERFSTLVSYQRIVTTSLGDKFYEDEIIHVLTDRSILDDLLPVQCIFALENIPHDSPESLVYLIDCGKSVRSYIDYVYEKTRILR